MLKIIYSILPCHIYSSYGMEFIALRHTSTQGIARVNSYIHKSVALARTRWSKQIFCVYSQETIYVLHRTKHALATTIVASSFIAKHISCFNMHRTFVSTNKCGPVRLTCEYLCSAMGRYLLSLINFKSLEMVCCCTIHMHVL